MQRPGKSIAHIRLPERRESRCFGGTQENRLHLVSCRSLRASCLESHGAV